MFQEVLTSAEKDEFNAVKKEAWLSEGFRTDESLCRQLIVTNDEGKNVGVVQLTDAQNIDLMDSPYAVFAGWPEGNDPSDVLVLDGFAMLREGLQERHLEQILGAIFAYAKDTETTSVVAFIDPLMYRILRFGYHLTFDEAQDASFDIQQLIPIHIHVPTLWKERSRHAWLSNFIHRHSFA